MNGRRGKEYQPWQSLRGQLFLGDDAFVNSLKPRLDISMPALEVPRSQREATLPDMGEIIRVVAARTGASMASFTVKRGGPARALAAYAARHLARRKMAEISPWLGV